MRASAVGAPSVARAGGDQAVVVVVADGQAEDARRRGIQEGAEHGLRIQGVQLGAGDGEVAKTCC